eukprot:14933932-Alexandrium_andersonii.AAC.1
MGETTAQGSDGQDPSQRTNPKTGARNVRGQASPLNAMPTGKGPSTVTRREASHDDAAKGFRQHARPMPKHKQQKTTRHRSPAKG